MNEVTWMIFLDMIQHFLMLCSSHVLKIMLISVGPGSAGLYISTPGEAKAGGSQVLGQCGPDGEFKQSLGNFK